MTYTGTVINDLLATTEKVMRCWWETPETRDGACDGGIQCKEKAVGDVEGVPYCAKHLEGATK